MLSLTGNQDVIDCMYGMDTVELYHGSSELSTEPLDEPGLPNTNAHALFDRLRTGLLVQAAGAYARSIAQHVSA